MLTINVGYSEKVGQPNFGSIGASCNIECELDGRPVFDDPALFYAKVRELYSACSSAAKEELARHQAGDRAATAAQSATREAPNGTAPATASKSPGNGEPANHRASKRQLEFVEQLARQIPRVGIRRLESLAQRVCGKPLAELSSFDASNLIDTLKAMKQGLLVIESALSGAAR
jgi:hypothetical protein